MRSLYYLFTCLALGLGSCAKSTPNPGPDSGASFSLSRSVVETGELVQATNTSQNATTYRWQALGMQDSVKTDANPTFTAGSVPGTYNVRLTAYTTAERSARTIVPVRIGRRTISTLRVTSVPATQPNGQPWHADGTGLNLSCDIYASPSIIGVKSFTGSAYTNVQPASLPLSWTPGVAFLDGGMSVICYDNVGGTRTSIASLPLLTTGPPANRDSAGNGSYRLELNGWTVVFEIETR
jgi:hypothetical protein